MPHAGCTRQRQKDKSGTSGRYCTHPNATWYTAEARGRHMMHHCGPDLQADPVPAWISPQGPQHTTRLFTTEQSIGGIGGLACDWCCATFSAILCIPTAWMMCVGVEPQHAAHTLPAPPVNKSRCAYEPDKCRQVQQWRHSAEN